MAASHPFRAVRMYEKALPPGTWPLLISDPLVPIVGSSEGEHLTGLLHHAPALGEESCDRATNAVVMTKAHGMQYQHPFQSHSGVFRAAPILAYRAPKPCVRLDPSWPGRSPL